MRFLSTAFVGLAVIGSAWAQPTVTGIANAANYSTDIAQGSIFVLFGTNLGPAQLVSVPSFPVPTTLGGTSIRFTPVAGGPAFDALVVYTSAGQVAGILQSPAPTGAHNVTVTYNGQTSAAFRANVVARNFGLISLAASGTGPAVAQIADLGSRVNQFGSPARPGQTLVLYGIGLGPITAPDNNPPGLQDLKGPANVAVLLGDVEVAPVYAGRSPGIPGLDQINFVVPANAPAGCTVPVRIRVAGVVTGSSTTLAIVRGGENFCSHPLYSEAALRRLDAGQTFNAGIFTLSSTSIVVSGFALKTERASGAFSEVTLANVADVASSDTAGLFVAQGSCSVYRVLVDDEANVVGARMRLLDAGTSLTLNGPGITGKALTKLLPAVNTYSGTLGSGIGGFPIPGQTPTAGISAGNFTLTGSGGPEVGAFSASVNVPNPIVWTNQSAVANSPIIRSSGLTLNWTGGSATDFVTIFGASGIRAGGTQQDPIFDATTFVCNARGDAGTFTVPASILTQLPASRGSFLDGSGVSIVSLQQSTATNAGRFTAPLTAGGTTDFGLFTYSIGGLSTVTFQ